MDWLSTSAFSLYQLARDESVRSPVASRAVLQSLLGASIDLLLEEQAVATLWLKLPPTASCWSEIQRYRTQTKAVGSIYLLGDAIAPPHLPVPAIALPLREEMELQREWLFLAKSPQLSVLIVARALENGEQYQVAYSFDPSAIARVEAGIQQAIATSDPPPELQAETVETPPLDPARVAYLLLERLETLQPPSDSDTADDRFFARGLQELSNTLTRMKTALSLLRSPSIKPVQRQRYLEMLQQECDRQNSLIGGMRSLVELNNEIEEAEPLKLADFVPGIISTYQPLAMEKGIQLGYTIPAELPLVVCPPNCLRQIILNLLNNSLRFTPPNGKVTVQASRQGEYVQLAFKDTGVGIAPNELAKIFDCFYRGRNSTEEDNAGVGLGLTSVQQLLLRCGGSISVTSQLNKGSTFKVLLPVAV